MKKNNEMLFVLSILKNPEKEFNANNIAKEINISPMGALKIARKLEKERILSSKSIGRAKIYAIDFNEYAEQYIKFLLKKEIEQSSPYIKMWVGELKKIKNSEAIILFGSVLKKEKQAGDIDILVLVDKKRFDKVKKEIESINQLNEKKIHPVYQTEEDFEKNLKQKDKIVLNALKGLYVFGEDRIIKVLK